MSEAVDVLQAWIGERFPQIAAMAEPFTRQQLGWMLRKYDVEDIRRIVAAMDNKGAWRNRSAFCTFTSYVGRDHELLTRRQAEAECGRLYTYLQMVQMLPTAGGPLADPHDTGLTNGSAGPPCRRRMPTACCSRCPGSTPGDPQTRNEMF